MVFRSLSPLVKSPSEIAYAKLNDLKPILTGNPYEKTEDQVLKEFDSSISIPQLVFLGLDESQTDGLQYKNYVGAPQFAVDITPKASYEEEAKDVVSELEKRGLTFIEGMRAMSFPANIGGYRRHLFRSLVTSSSCHLCNG
jgi:NAD+ diphosphatase